MTVKSFCKSTVIVFSMAVVLMMLSCGIKPNDISDEHYQYGKKAIEIIDNYLDYEIDVKEAYQQFEELLERQETLPETEFGDYTHTKNFSVEVEVTCADGCFLRLRYTPSNDDLTHLIEHRNNIADEIGERHR